MEGQSRSTFRSLAVAAAATTVLGAGYATDAAAQDKFKLGMAVGGNHVLRMDEGAGRRRPGDRRGARLGLHRALATTTTRRPRSRTPTSSSRKASTRSSSSTASPRSTRSSPSASVRPTSRSSPTTSPSRASTSSASTISRPVIAGGEALGNIIKEKWNCEPDLVISAEGAAAGIVNEWRTGGMRDGLKKVCPDIPAEKWVSFEIVRARRPSACPPRAISSPLIPTPRRWRVVGLNDGGVLAAINAAEQLGRADEIIGWGQDGAFITGDNVNPHLAGSVFYFLEGYAVYAIRDVIDADRRRQPAAGQGRCRRSRLAGRAVPGLGRGSRQGAGHAGAGEAAPRGARRARPSTSCSVRTSKDRDMADHAIGHTVATGRPGMRFRLDGWGTAAVVALAWVALIAISGDQPRRLHLAPDGACDHLHHVDRRRARRRPGAGRNQRRLPRSLASRPR